MNYTEKSATYHFEKKRSMSDINVRGKCTQVVVLDLLPDTPINKIFEEIFDAVSKSTKGVTAVRHRISSARQLEQVMIQVAEDEELPIVHIDGHGCDEGILISESGEICKWKDLHQLLRPVNVKLQCRLLVLYSTCFGAYACMGTDFEDEAPFLGTIGFTSEVSENDAIEFYRDFYSQLDDIGFIDELIKKCRNHEQTKLSTIHWYFMNGIEEYIKLPPKEIRRKLFESTKLLQKQLREAGRYISTAKVNKLVLEQTTISGRKKLFIDAAKKFFMYSRNPQIYREFEVEESIQRMGSR